MEINFERLCWRVHYWHYCICLEYKLLVVLVDNYYPYPLPSTINLEDYYKLVNKHNSISFKVLHQTGMCDTKLNRDNLRRQAQRIESYSVLVSKKKTIYKNRDAISKKTREESVSFNYDAYHNNEMQDDQKCKKKNRTIHSPSSSIMSSSSNNSNENLHMDLPSGADPKHCSSFQTEVEMTSVMTRSAMRKYASVGAIHNRVNFDQELKVVRKWPSSISYPIPGAPSDITDLRNIVNRSFQQVLTFCKNAKVLIPQCQKSYSPELHNSSVNLTDLSPYLTQDPEIVSENNDTHIRLHLNDNLLKHQYINIISLNEEDENGTLVIQEGDEDRETITLHSGETYLLDNNYFSSNESYFNNNPNLKNAHPGDPMSAIKNDHTYAMKCSEQVSVTTAVDKPVQLSSSTVNKEEEFNLETSLNNLLLNTAILKCLICGETPQEMITLLDNFYF